MFRAVREFRGPLWSALDFSLRDLAGRLRAGKWGEWEGHAKARTTYACERRLLLVLTPSRPTLSFLPPIFYQPHSGDRVGRTTAFCPHFFGTNLFVDSLRSVLSVNSVGYPFRTPKLEAPDRREHWRFKASRSLGGTHSGGVLRMSYAGLDTGERKLFAGAAGGGDFSESFLE